MAWTERFARADAPGGGDGTTEGTSGPAAAWTLAEAAAAAAPGLRVNLKAGTYAHGASTRTFAGVGTTTAPIWWRGYDATPGDLDDDPSGPRPTLTFGAAQMAVSGAHQIFSNLAVSAAHASQAVNVTGANCKLDRMRVENAGAAANSLALRASASGLNVTRCWLKAAPQAAYVAELTFAGALLGTVLEGGLVGARMAGTAPACVGCVFDRNGSHALQFDCTVLALAVACTIHGAGGDGIRLVGQIPSNGLLANNLIGSCGGYGIHNALGAATNVIERVGNAYWANASGEANGFGDSPGFARLTLGGDPWAARLGGDLTPAAGSAARGAAAPGRFDGRPERGRGDVGAVQSGAQGQAIILVED